MRCSSERFAAASNFAGHSGGIEPLSISSTLIAVQTASAPANRSRRSLIPRKAAIPSNHRWRANVPAKHLPLIPIAISSVSACPTRPSRYAIAPSAAPEKTAG